MTFTADLNDEDTSSSLTIIASLCEFAVSIVVNYLLFFEVSFFVASDGGGC